MAAQNSRLEKAFKRKEDEWQGNTITKNDDNEIAVGRAREVFGFDMGET